MKRLSKYILSLGLLLFAPIMLMAEESATTVPVLDSGNTAWIITATVLVLMMTIPGLALFYGGLVRSKYYDAMSYSHSCYQYRMDSNRL